MYNGNGIKCYNMRTSAYTFGDKKGNWYFKYEYLKIQTLFNNLKLVSNTESAWSNLPSLMSLLASFSSMSLKNVIAAGESRRRDSLAIKSNSDSNAAHREEIKFGSKLPTTIWNKSLNWLTEIFLWQTKAKILIINLNDKAANVLIQVKLYKPLVCY